MKETLATIQAERQRYLNELLELLRIPSISADPAYKDDVAKTADAVAGHLRQAGVQVVEVCPTAGHPIVYGEHIVDPSLPTVLVYGHYDVQPPDPLDLWDSPPFEPVIKETESIHKEPFSRAVPVMTRGRCLCMSKPLRR